MPVQRHGLDQRIGTRAFAQPELMQRLPRDTRNQYCSAGIELHLGHRAVRFHDRGDAPLYDVAERRGTRPLQRQCDVARPYAHADRLTNQRIDARDEQFAARKLRRVIS